MIPHRLRNVILANVPGKGHIFIFLVLKNSLAQDKSGVLRLKLKIL